MGFLRFLHREDRSLAVQPTPNIPTPEEARAASWGAELSRQILESNEAQASEIKALQEMASPFVTTIDQHMEVLQGLGYRVEKTTKFISPKNILDCTWTVNFPGKAGKFLWIEVSKKGMKLSSSLLMSKKDKSVPDQIDLRSNDEPFSRWLEKHLEAATVPEILDIKANLQFKKR